MAEYKMREPMCTSFIVKCGAMGIVVRNYDSNRNEMQVEMGFSTKADFIAWIKSDMLEPFDATDDTEED